MAVNTAIVVNFHWKNLPRSVLHSSFVECLAFRACFGTNDAIQHLTSSVRGIALEKQGTTIVVCKLTGSLGQQSRGVRWRLR